MDNEMDSQLSSSPLRIPLPSNDHLRQLFGACDTDGSGFLCQYELRELCSRFGIAAADADAIFCDLDVDGDGKISFEDFRCGFDDYEKGILTSSSMSPSSTSGFENIKRSLETNQTQSETNQKEKYNKKLINNSKKTVRSSETGVEAQPVIQELLDSVRKLQEENQRLANSWMREKKEHERHLHQLEEEVDCQVKEVEVRVKQKAKEEVEAERKSLREMMKGEMEELQTHLSMFEKVDSWLKSNQNNVHDDKMSEIRTKLEDAIQENRQLRLGLLDTQTNVALMRSELSQLRVQYEEKCKELSNEKEKIFESHHDQDHLSQQLYLLQDANKRLQDTNDTLRTVIDVTAKPCKESSPMGTSATDVLRLNMSPNRFKRGSLIGDYLRQDSNKSYSRVSETDIESISTIEDEASVSQYSFASCPAGVSSLPLQKILDDEFDSGLSSTVRDEEFISPSSTHFSRLITSRSLQPSPDLNGRTQIIKSSSTNCMLSKESQINDKIDGNETQSIRPPPILRDANGPPERTYKIIFIGDASVGKSTFIIRLSKNVFASQLSTTLGVDFQVRTFFIDDRNVALQLWDTAGQERYRSITKSYFRKADGIMLLYDVTNEASFLNVREWINAVEEVTSKGVPVMIIGNKIDIRSPLQAQEQRCIKTEEGYQLSQQFGVMFYEVSCKEGSNVFEAIGHLTRVMTENEDKLIQCAGMQLTNSKGKKLFGCCS